MFNNDINLIFEAYQKQSIQEGKMKDIMTAIEAGEDVDEVISSCNLDDTEEVRAMVTSARDDYYEKGEKSEEDGEVEETPEDQELDENEESQEGAVNLLEQLKEEMPELEDKVNQILEKVFDVVDILVKEPYADDPELRKAYGSLIEDHIRAGAKRF